MTEKEAIKRLEEFGLYHAIGDLPNSAFTVKAFEMAIKALEEIQQYRAIETEIREQYHANVDIKGLMQCFIETIFKGEKHEGFCILTNEDAKMWKEYQEIGTGEECREAMERQRAKKPEFELNLSDYTSRFICECGKRIIVKHDSGVMDNHDAPNYCSNCGRKFNWSDQD